MKFIIKFFKGLFHRTTACHFEDTLYTTNDDLGHC